MKTTKICINSETLLNALQMVAKVFTKSVAVPIIENYLFQVSNGMLTVSATDLVNTLKLTFKIEGKEALFSACVPPTIIKYLQKLIKSSGPAPIILNYNPENFAIEITDEIGRAKYAGDNSVDFPVAPQTNSNYWETTSDLFKEFKDLLNYVDTDELRPAMCGIAFVTHESKLNLCATNGHVLKYVDMTGEVIACDGVPAESEKQHFILGSKPAKILSEFKFVDASGKKKTEYAAPVMVRKGEAEVIGKYHATTSKFTSFSFDYQDYKVELITRDIDERYPEYWNVVPTPEETQTKFAGDKQNFLSVLDRAHLFANKTTHQVRLSLNGKNKLSAEDLDFNNEYCAEIYGSYEGAPIEIGFNANFLALIISSFGDNFTLEMREPRHAAIIRDGKSVALAMPVMLVQNV